MNVDESVAIERLAGATDLLLGTVNIWKGPGEFGETKGNVAAVAFTIDRFSTDGWQALRTIVDAVSATESPGRISVVASDVETPPVAGGKDIWFLISFPAGKSALPVANELMRVAKDKLRSAMR